MLDADVVPLVSPAELLTFQEYTKSGAYFFQDRSLLDKNYGIETNYLAKLMPHASSTLDMAMGIPPVSDKTMANLYMWGWRHMQDAGVMMFNKKHHFKTLVPLVALSLWKEPLQSCFLDKELYWLAMAVTGDDEYTPNDFGAASIGVQVSKPEMKLFRGSLSNEVCSTHVGHLTPQGRLLWMNSGFSYCKRNG